MLKTILIIALTGFVNSANFPRNLPSNLPNNLPNIDNCDVPCTLEANQLVCSFDGQNYKFFDSKCDYNKAKCLNAANKKLIKVPVAECLMRQDKRTINIDICAFPCPLIENPVCGYDGEKYKIFANGCLMGKQACDERRFWRLVPMENCPHVNPLPVECPQICPLNYDPVCGYNGRNYTVFANKCNLDSANCLSIYKWTQVRLSTCNERLNYTLDYPESEKVDNCPKFCTRIFLPVCGSDGQKKKIFSNDCLLRKEKCEKNQNLHRVIMSECLFRE